MAMGTAGAIEMATATATAMAAVTAPVLLVARMATMMVQW
jgi:hypothetical protein